MAKTKTTTKTPKSQTGKILSYLQSGKTLTVQEAKTRFGVRKLSARICDLRNSGNVIDTVKKNVRGVGTVTGYTLNG